MTTPDIPTGTTRRRRRRPVLRTDLHAEFLQGGNHPILFTIRLAWHARTPDVIAVDFGPDQPRWLLGRELLHAGCDGPAGLGDVALLPDPVHLGAVELVLSSPSGTAAIRLQAARLRAYLDRITDHIAAHRPTCAPHWQITDHELHDRLYEWRTA